jgi:electron transfer flavoprotein beta subunit
MLKMPLPCLLTVVKEISYPRLPTLRGKQRARKATLPIWGPADLDVDESLLGLKGSPTKVVKIRKPKVVRKGTIISLNETEPSRAASELADFLEEKNLL